MTLFTQTKFHVFIGGGLKKPPVPLGVGGFFFKVALQNSKPSGF